jgi:hypothetical protein
VRGGIDASIWNIHVLSRCFRRKGVSRKKNCQERRKKRK